MRGWLGTRRRMVAALIALVATLGVSLAGCGAPGLGVDPTAAARTAIADGQTKPYHTRLPGDGCDTNGGLWSTGHNTTLACGADASHIEQGPDSITGEIFLFWKDGYTFPADQSVAVTVTGLKKEACAGLHTRMRLTDNGAYGFYICEDGKQLIVRYHATSGLSTTIGGDDQPHAPSGTTFTITASSIGDQQCMQVTGQQKFCVTDAMYKTTDDVGVVVFSTESEGSADFSDFTFTPLP